MKSAGEILRQERLSKNLSLEEVAATTKIHLHFLTALEENRYDLLPSFTSARGFLKNYADFLGLPSKELTALFRRDFPVNQSPEIVAHALINPVNQPRFVWNTKLTGVLIVAVFILLIGAYLLFQYLSLVRPPQIRLDSPSDQARFSTSSVLVSGQTDPDARVEINNQAVVLSEDGRFQMEVLLFSGQNNLVVKAISRRGRETVLRRQVFYNKE